MYYYCSAKPDKQTENMGRIIAEYCSRRLGIQAPEIIFIRECIPGDIVCIEYHISVNGLANPAKGRNGTIYVHVDRKEIRQLAQTIAHETWHIYEGIKGLHHDESNACKYAESLLSGLI